MPESKAYLVLCEVVPKDVQTYRHFEADISVCKKVMEVPIEDIPSTMRERLEMMGELMFKDIGEVPEKLAIDENIIKEVKSGNKYLKLIITR